MIFLQGQEFRKLQISPLLVQDANKAISHTAYGRNRLISLFALKNQVIAQIEKLLLDQRRHLHIV